MVLSRPFGWLRDGSSGDPYCFKHLHSEFVTAQMYFCMILVVYPFALPGSTAASRAHVAADHSL